MTFPFEKNQGLLIGAMFENFNIRRSIKKWLFMFLGVLSFFTILTSLGIGTLLGYVKSLPPIEQLENYSPPQLTEMLDRSDSAVIGRFYRENRVVTPLRDMPQDLINAFLAIEDKRFYQHFGVDFIRTLKALMVDIRHMRPVEGASTITQQLPRNLLPSVGRKKVIQRKIKELLLALKIEQRYSKDQILEFYLNQIYLGNGAYGVQAAARTFFDKDVKNLSLAQCATLAGIPRSFQHYSPINNPKMAAARRNLVLSLTRDAGLIDDERYQKAIREPLVVQPREPRPNKAPYFTEFVRQQIEEKTGISGEDLRQERYVIHSTLDMELQNIAEQELKKGLREVELLWEKNKYARFLQEEEDFKEQPLQKGQVRLAKIRQVFSDKVVVELDQYSARVESPNPLPYYTPGNVIKIGGYLDIEIQDVDHEKNTLSARAYDRGRIQGAILALDAHTGQIRAMVGGEEFYDQANNGMWNRATQARRQPGSSFKPFVYAAAFELGFTPATIFVDQPIVFPDGYAPKNYENEFFGPTTLEEAIEKSRNVVTILLFQSLGARHALEIMRRFDFAQSRGSWQLPTDPTVALGNIGVTLLELTAAYIPFINGGVGIEPLGVTQVCDNNGKIVAELRPRERVIISPQTAYMVTRVLLGAVERGTGAETIGSYFEGKKVPEIGGKTGTTNDCIDAWFVGFTPDLVIGVYVGFDQVRTLGPVMTGSRVAAPIWRDFLDRALKTRSDWHYNVPEPEGIVYADVCSESGRLATRGCYQASETRVFRRMAFKKGTEPTENCTLH